MMTLYWRSLNTAESDVLFLQTFKFKTPDKAELRDPARFLGAGVDMHLLVFSSWLMHPGFREHDSTWFPSDHSLLISVWCFTQGSKSCPY